MQRTNWSGRCGQSWRGGKSGRSGQSGRAGLGQGLAWRTRLGLAGCLAWSLLAPMAAGAPIAYAAAPQSAAQAPAAAGEALTVQAHSVTVNRAAGTASFTTTFNRAPDFTTTDAAGRQADSFQYFITGDPAAPQPLDTVIRGEEIHLTPGRVRIRSAAPSDPSPSSGGWGAVRGEVPYALSGNVLTFSAPLQMVSDRHIADGRFPYRVETYQNGSMTDGKSGTALAEFAQLTVIQDLRGGAAGRVISQPGGIDCGTDCQEWYSGGTVTLTATAAPGSTFVAWGGACTGTPKGSPCTVTMDDDKRVAALFKANADLRLSMTDAPDPARVGQPLRYTITVTNAGPHASGAVKVTDVLPPSLAYGGATPSQGTVATSVAGGETTVTWTVGALESGASATLVLVVTPSVAGTVQNSASVQSSVTFDPVGSNNRRTAATTVAAP